MDTNESTDSVDFDTSSLAELASEISGTPAAPAADAKPADAPPADAVEDWESQWREPKDEDDDLESEPEPKKDDDLQPDPADDKETWRKERLNKVLEQRNKERTRAEDAERKAIALEARLQALEQGRQPAPQIQPVEAPGSDPFLAELVRVDPEANALARTLEDIKAGRKEFATNAEYIDAMTDAKVALLQRRNTVFSQVQAQQEQAQTSQQTELQQIMTNYTTAIEKSEIPQAKRFAEVFEKVGPALHPEIRRAILSAPDADVLVASIVSDRKRYDRLMDETKRAGSGFPVHGIAALGEFRATYQRPQAAAATGTPAQAPKQAPSPRLPAAPASRGGRSSNYEDMDAVEYARKLLKGEVKNVL